MELKIKFSYILLAVHFVVLCNVIKSSEVPVILWNIKGDSLHLRPISAFENKKKIFEDSMKDVLHKTSSSILVFAINELSMEDFSANEKIGTTNSTLQSLETFLDQNPHMLLPSVKDPLNRIHKAHCGVEEIIVDQGIDDNVLQSVALAIDRSCAVVLHVSNAGVVTKRGKSDFEHIKNIFSPAFQKTNKNVVGMFTSMKSSWESASSDHHSFRNLLEIDEGENDKHFINYTGCIIMYVENATMKIGDVGNETVTLELPPKLDGSDCTNSSAILQLAFAAPGEISEVILKLTFAKRGASWVTSDRSLQLTGAKAPEGEIKLAGQMPEASIGFSYSCGDFVLKGKNVTEPITLTFTAFQIQPYDVKEVFDSSFDCVPFFTIPIWMGIFVALLFIIIINVGVYALFSVNTMDRFDDPKGKSITVAASVD